MERIVSFVLFATIVATPVINNIDMTGYLNERRAYEMQEEEEQRELNRRLEENRRVLEIDIARIRHPFNAPYTKYLGLHTGKEVKDLLAICMDNAYKYDEENRQKIRIQFNDLIAEKEENIFNYTDYIIQSLIEIKEEEKYIVGFEYNDLEISSVNIFKYND